MTTLITGGTGFIGSYLAKQLIKKGETPVLLDIVPPGIMLEEEAGQFKFIQDSLSNLSVLINNMKDHNIHRIFHLGGMLSVSSENNPWMAMDTNIMGTYNILEASRLTGVQQVIFGSTIATYSKGIQTPVIDDNTIQRPTSMYGITKVCSEMLGRFYHRRFDIDFRGIRIPSVVGPGARTEHMSIYNAWAIEHPLQGKPYTLKCDPDTRCPIIYFKDVVRALIKLADEDINNISTRIYNLAGIYPAVSAKELIDEIIKQIPDASLTFKPEAKIVELLKELGSIPFDDSCAQNEWGWKIAYPLTELIQDFINEFDANHSDKKKE